ncbi:MAG: hypothetical protein JNK02_05195 [Planctomycetes bacterium]|nr:hypothetical protein [Planctomycetota bacterium]
MTKRSSPRRSEEDQIRDLQAQIAELRAQAEAKTRKDLPVVRAWPKTQRALREFIQVATDHHRPDLAISAQAFMAGVERSLDPEIALARSKRTRKEREGDPGDGWGN